MAEACNVTARAGASHSRGFEDAVNARIAGELQGDPFSLKKRSIMVQAKNFEVFL